MNDEKNIILIINIPNQDYFSKFKNRSIYSLKEYMYNTILTFRYFYHSLPFVGITWKLWQLNSGSVFCESLKKRENCATMAVHKYSQKFCRLSRFLSKVTDNINRCVIITNKIVKTLNSKLLTRFETVSI